MNIECRPLVVVAVAVLLCAGGLAVTLDSQSQDVAPQQPNAGVWRNYDFTPGREVWFASDFTSEPVGRFPASQLEFAEGNMQIVELNGEKALEVSRNSVFKVMLREDLPEDFSVEFLVKAGAPNLGTTVLFTPRRGAWNRYDNQYVTIDTEPGIYFQSRPVSSTRMTRGAADEFRPVRLQVDGDSAVMYLGPDRVANLPKATFLRSNAIEFHVSGNARLQTYIKEIVVAVGIDSLYDTLAKTGAFTTRGILFASGSDVISPESTPVLEELRAALTDHPELKVVIEGHTDNVGTDTANAALSERRAQAVTRYLASNGVATERVTAIGKGEAEPVADNATPAGRAENRRVVIRQSPPG